MVLYTHTQVSTYILCSADMTPFREMLLRGNLWSNCGWRIVSQRKAEHSLPTNQSGCIKLLFFDAEIYIALYTRDVIYGVNITVLAVHYMLVRIYYGRPNICYGTVPVICSLVVPHTHNMDVY